MTMISYNDEYVNLDNVIYAKRVDDKCVKLYVVGSAGAGRRDSYDIQHREINLYWPADVFEDLCRQAGGVTFYNN